MHPIPVRRAQLVGLLIAALLAAGGCVTGAVVHGQRVTVADSAGERRTGFAVTPAFVNADSAVYTLPEGRLIAAGGVTRVELGLVGLLLPIIPVAVRWRPEPRDMVEVELRLMPHDSASSALDALVFDPRSLQLAIVGGVAAQAACIVPEPDAGPLWMAPDRTRCADWRWPRWPFKPSPDSPPPRLAEASDGTLRYELRPGRRVFVLFPLHPDPAATYELRLDGLTGAAGSERRLAVLRFRSDWGAGLRWMPFI